jgi:glutathione reductase (NADPH)
MSSFDFDLFVIGAGSGGVRAARISASHGARVAIAEADRVGGTCIIRGCVPKKLLVLAGRFADGFHDAVGYGWQIGSHRHSWQALMAAKDREVARLEALYTAGLQAAGVKLISGRAVIVDRHTVCVGKESRKYTAANIIVATGSRSVRDEGTPGVEHTVTSSDMFSLCTLPEKLAIVGGGYVAIEFAGLMQALGSSVTLIHRGDHVLRGFDDDLRGALESAYLDRGIKLRLDTGVERITALGQRKEVKLKDGTTEQYDLVMYATGRRPNSEGLGLERVGVNLNGRAIVVDDHSTTNIPSIHAVGDVTDRANLTTVAIREGHALAERLFGERIIPVNYAVVPTAVFSTPEIGTVGLSEREAIEAGLKISVFTRTFRPFKSALAGGGDQRSVVKLIVDDSSDKVVGVHVIGDSAAEIIQMAAVAMTCGATKAQYDNTIPVHPSAGEEIVTMPSSLAVGRG